MPTPRKSQKQIAQKYSGNLRYFKNVHGFRMARILAVLIIALIAIGLGAFYLLGMKASSRFEGLSTSGGISQSHAQFAKDCAKCHDPNAKVDPLNPAVLNASLDAKCETCHVAHTFHQPNVVENHSCTTCHHEHLGTGPMQQVTDTNCVTCHGNADIMADSSQKGLKIPAGDFKLRPKDTTLVYFQPTRPGAGYTQIFTSFEGNHPPFQIEREKLTDPDTLKFNHKIHLTGDIPMVDGKKLDCDYCHKPDSRGAYMQPMTFAKDCQACHSLQIDPTLPDFQIPHPTVGGQAESARDFILTLPTQYANYAAQKKGMTSATDIAAFVNKHMLAIRQRVRAGEDLEKEVFFADSRSVNLGGPTPANGRERALFPGCAYCHEVKANAVSEPTITKPVIMDRWMVHAQFDHGAHITMRCTECHGQVLHSVATSDINLPDKASCVVCHSTKGKVVSTCATCHDYHNEAPIHAVADLLKAPATTP